MMSKKIRKALIEWNPISDRIMTARICTKVRTMNIIQCYAPTNVDEDVSKDTFYSQLSKVMNNIHPGEINILMGDLNAKVGNNNNNCERTLGKHGVGTRNDNGEILLELCLQNKLIIGGNIFPHKDVHKLTWKSPRGDRNQIDHICINQRWRHTLLDVRVKRGADVFTDHYMLMATIQLKIMAAKKKEEQQKKNTNLSRNSRMWN